MKKYALILILSGLVVAMILYSAYIAPRPSIAKNSEFASIQDITPKTETAYKIIGGELVQDSQAILAPPDVAIWDYFRAVIPIDLRQNIAVLEIVQDPSLALIANISSLDDLKSWKLKINKAEIYLESSQLELNKDLLKAVFIHEIGHILTLNSDQISFDTSLKNIANKTDYPKIFADSESKCQPNYFVQEGCTKTESYLNQFYQKFWQSIWVDYLLAQNTSSNQLFTKRSQEFYTKNQNSFVSRIAAFSPEEDIAESFSAFVLRDRPPNLTTIADQKLAWLWDQPELVVIRQNILNNINNSK